MADQELERVGLNLNQVIVSFWKLRLEGKAANGVNITDPFPTRFTANELRQYVQHHNFGTAPASADRVMRNLKNKSVINYAVVNRSKSLYVALPVKVVITPLGTAPSA